jgi:NADP-reducing hydrogenase subunit HndD
MVNLSINGMQVKVPKGTTILDAAKKQNFRIPTLCHHDDLCVAGNCRVCVVEQLGGKSLWLLVPHP